MFFNHKHRVWQKCKYCDNPNGILSKRRKFQRNVRKFFFNCFGMGWGERGGGGGEGQWDLIRFGYPGSC